MQNFNVIKEEIEERFLVKFSNSKSYHIVASLQPISSLSLIVKQLLPTLNILLFKRKPIKEIVLDFVKEDKDSWYFLGIKGYLLKGEYKNPLDVETKTLSLQTNLVRYPVISVSRVQTPPSSEELAASPQKRLEKRKITRASKKLHRQATGLSLSDKIKISIPTPDEQYSFYLSQKKSDNLGRVPFNMIGIVPQKLGTHITSFIETKRTFLRKDNFPYEPPLGMYMLNPISVKSNEIYLQEVSNQLDDKIDTAKNMKKKTIWANKIKTITEVIGDSLESVFEKFMAKLQKNEILSEFFESMSSSSITSKVDGFIKMLKGNLNKCQLQKMHENSVITEVHYNEFMKVLEEVLNEFMVPESELILESFLHHKKDFVQEVSFSNL